MEAEDRHTGSPGTGVTDELLGVLEANPEFCAGASALPHWAVSPAPQAWTLLLLFYL